MIINECAIAEIQHLVTEYLGGLSSPFDSFLEDHILASAFYRIQDGSEDVGYYAIHNGERLTQFSIRRAYLKHARKLFLQALERHAVKYLFVPTSDELLLSLAIDQDFVIHKQAFFFQDSRAHVEADGAGEGGEDAEGGEFRLATPGDRQAIERVCGDFLDDYERRITRGELFVFYRGEELLGIGVLERSRLFEGLASIGMFANEAYRKRGIGTAIIVRLRQWCRDRGIAPVSGCWYYNEASKRTLESGGMVTKTRLLNFEVTQPQAE